MVTSTPVLALVAALVTWRPLQLAPLVGLDPSWATGLAMATHRGLDFGTQVIFTYGPLGFLKNPLTMYGGLAVLATVYVVALHVGLAATVLWATRRTLPLPVAFLVAVAASLVATPDAVVVIVFLCCTAAISAEPPRASSSIVIYGGAVISAIEALAKLNTGFLVLALCLVTVLVLPGSRLANLARFLGVFLAAFAALWFGSGQGIGNLDDYVRTAFALTMGYSGALSATAGRAWTPDAAVLLISATIAASILAAQQLRRAPAVGLVVLTLLLCLLGWKEGFVRQDAGHEVVFFSWMVAPWIALTWAGSWGRIAGLAGFSVVVVLFYAGTGTNLGTRLHPIDNARAAIDDVHDLIDPATRGAERDRARLALAVEYGLDRRTLRLIDQRPMDVYPWETSLVWAYGLNWDPLPVFHSTTVYTSLLDHRNAAALGSPDGPRLILRHAVTPPNFDTAAALDVETKFSIDGRYAPYDAPAATLAMLCNFEPLRTTARFQLLGRVPDRCGTPREIGSVTAAYGQSVHVPRPRRPDEIVFARVSGLTPTGIERLQALLYRPGRRWIVFNGKRVYRIVPATADDGLILTAPPGADFPGPWSLAPDPRGLAFERESGWASSDNKLGIDFYAMPVRPSR